MTHVARRFHFPWPCSGGGARPLERRTEIRRFHQSTASTDGFIRLGQPYWSLDDERIWVSMGRDWEKDSTGQFKNTLAWVNATTGEFHEIGTEGKAFRERPLP